MGTVENHEIDTTNLCASNLLLKIGDIRMRVYSEDSTLQLRVKQANLPFLVSDGPADVELRSEWRKLSQPLRTSLIFDSGGLWQLHSEEDHFVFYFTSPRYGLKPYKRVACNRHFTTGEILLDPEYFDRREAVDVLEYPLDELLTMNLLAQGRGIELHACGIQDTDGSGYIFLGQSGAGKTTLARLWEKVNGVQVLSDDRVIVRSGGNQIWMYGTPWHGDAGLASPARTPVRAIFFLARGALNETACLRKAKAIAQLMACSFLPFYDSAALVRILDFFQQLTDLVPCRELRFVPEVPVIEFVRASFRERNEIL